ncbi:MAG: polysaccharide deacetylase family protein [Planctomycetia bacterium]|jgi:peptidoglycan/xylan/chitin deacetylase (PgdA/CDA1 family)
MAFWKDALVTLYYGGTLPYRNWRVQHDGQLGNVPLVSLFYHRVAPEMNDSWTITNELFKAQLDWLGERFEFISLHQLQRRMTHNRNDRPAVAITFDDGYADNMDYAIPLLLDRDIPFTYFVTLHNALSGQQFEHDAKMGNDAWPNTIDQIREMVQWGVDIGHHGRHHVDFGAITDRDELYDEIVTARQELEEAIGTKVEYLAFPYGLHRNMSPEACNMAFQAGYEGVCSAYGGYNRPGDNPFHIQRFHGDPEMPRFKNQAYFDPRKSRVPVFDCEVAAGHSFKT